MPNVVSSRSSGAPTTVRQMRYMSRKASPPCWITAMGRDLVKKEFDMVTMVRMIIMLKKMVTMVTMITFTRSGMGLLV